MKGSAAYSDWDYGKKSWSLFWLAICIWFYFKMIRSIYRAWYAFERHRIFQEVMTKLVDDISKHIKDDELFEKMKEAKKAEAKNIEEVVEDESLNSFQSAQETQDTQNPEISVNISDVFVVVEQSKDK